MYTGGVDLSELGNGTAREALETESSFGRIARRRVKPRTSTVTSHQAASPTTTRRPPTESVFGRRAGFVIAHATPV